MIEIMNTEHLPMLLMGAKRDSTYETFDWLSSIPAGTIYAPYYPFMDNDYDDSGFLNGNYTLGPFADLDKMNQLFSFLEAIGVGLLIMNSSCIIFIKPNH